MQAVHRIGVALQSPTWDRDGISRREYNHRKYCGASECTSALAGRHASALSSRRDRMLHVLGPAVRERTEVDKHRETMLCPVGCLMPDRFL